MSGPHRPSPLERAQQRLAQGEADLAQNAREQVLFRRILTLLPVAGCCVGAAIWLVFGMAAWGAITACGALGVAALTSGTGLYMTAVRKREFEDAIRDARVEIARMGRADEPLSSQPEDPPGS